MGELVHLRLETKTRKAIQEAIKEAHFSSESEFIRDAIRERLERYENIRAIWALRGSGKLRKHPPKTLPSNIFREFGLE